MSGWQLLEIVDKLEYLVDRIPVVRDHMFIPETIVGSVPIRIDVGNGFIWKIKNLGNHPVLFNIDRPIGIEYGIVPPMGYIVVARAGNVLYLVAPEGQSTVVKIDVLRCR